MQSVTFSMFLFKFFSYPLATSMLIQGKPGFKLRTGRPADAVQPLLEELLRYFCMHQNFVALSEIFECMSSLFGPLTVYVCMYVCMIQVAVAVISMERTADRAKGRGP